MSESPAPDELAFDFVDRLHKALRLGKVKPGEMAQVLGVSSSTMTNYLKGKSRPKDGMLRQWALRCGPPVTFEWLAYGAEVGPDDPSEQVSRTSPCLTDDLRERRKQRNLRTNRDLPAPARAA